MNQKYAKELKSTQQTAPCKWLCTSEITKEVQCADSAESVIIMKNVKVVPGLVKNLFSLSTVMRNDWDLLTETKADNKVENKEKQCRIQIRQKGIGKCKWRIFDVNGNCT